MNTYQEALIVVPLRDLQELFPYNCELLSAVVQPCPGGLAVVVHIESSHLGGIPEDGQLPRYTLKQFKEKVELR